MLHSERSTPSSSITNSITECRVSLLHKNIRFQSASNHSRTHPRYRHLQYRNVPATTPPSDINMPSALAETIYSNYPVPMDRCRCKLEFILPSHTFKWRWQYKGISTIIAVEQKSNPWDKIFTKGKPNPKHQHCPPQNNLYRRIRRKR